jgi:hypothetical protein
MPLRDGRIRKGRTDHHTLRGLLAGTPDGGTAIAAVAWCAGLTLAGYLWAQVLLRHPFHPPISDPRWSRVVVLAVKVAGT